MIARIKVGRFEAFPLSDGRFKLDGGAMFGVVPKRLWDRHDPADADNRIALNLGALLIRTPRGRNVLVDAGLSSKYDRNRKFLDIYAVDRPRTLREEMAELGVLPKDIRLVINTHLHFDHAGGDTEFGEGGLPAPAFPSARYLIQKNEWEDAQHPHERNKASYLDENYAILEERRLLELVDGEYEIEPGLTVIRSGGHTRGHQVVKIASEGETAIFLGDLIPTGSHLPLPYIMAYDLFPLGTLETKRALLKRALDEGWTLIFQHDVRRRSCKLGFKDGRYFAKSDAAAAVSSS